MDTMTAKQLAEGLLIVMTTAAGKFDGYILTWHFLMDTMTAKQLHTPKPHGKVSSNGADSVQGASIEYRNVSHVTWTSACKA